MAPPPRPDPKAALLALRRPMVYLRAHVPAVVVALMSIFAVMAANLAIPLVVRTAIDDGVSKGDWHALGVAVGLLVAAGVVRGLFGFLQDFLANRTSQLIAYALREDLFAKMQRLSFSYYDKTETGQLLTRLTNDVEQVRAFLGQGVLQLVQSLVMLVLSAAAILWLDWRLAIVTLLTVAPIILLLGRFTTIIGPIFGQIQHLMGRMNTVLGEALAGVKLVRAFGREGYEAERYGVVNGGLLDLMISATRASSNTFPFIMLFSSLGTFAIIGLGGYGVIQGRLTIGTLLAFTSYLGFLIQPLMTLGFSLIMITRAGVSAGRIAELFDAPLDVTDKPNAVTLDGLTGALSFENVSFRYPGAEKDVLTGVSFEVKAGETIAVVGMTGSGKTSLVHLLPRFYDVTAGAVKVDGHDVRDLTLASLRRQIAVVLQEPLLFGGTIADNLAYGRPDATRADIAAAARMAMADTFIEALPDGYDTVIGERGVGLSGGQRQRVAIARALLVDPRLIILDDSTSAVDTETEAAIQASLDRLMREATRTCMVVAQRLSTVRDADRILVLDQGRLVAQGTHEDLLATSPVYQDIVGTQLVAKEATL